MASAYASMKCTDEAITELKTILRSDPTDVLARHDLALCFRNKGWLKEPLEDMRKANEYAVTYGNAEEKDIIKSSLGHIEEDILHIDKCPCPSAGTLEAAIGRIFRQSPRRGCASYF